MKIEEIKQKIVNDIESATNLKELDEVKIKYTSKKGIITELQQEIRNIPNEDKKEYGMKVNEVRNLFNTEFNFKKENLEKDALNKKLESETIDI